MAAAAFLLAIGQLGNALGVRDKGNGHMQVLRRVWLTLFHGDHINYRALILSAAAVVLAVVLRKLVQRFGWPQIDMLAVLIITALIAYLAGWSVPGPAGIPRCRWPRRSRGACPRPHIPEVHTDWLPESVDGRVGHRVRRHHRGAVDRQSHCLPDPTEDRLQPADHGRRPGQPRRRLLPEPAGLGLAVALGDQFPVRCENTILRDRLGRNGRRGVAAVRAVTAVRSAAGAGRAVARHRRAAGRFQAVDLHAQSIAL